MNGCIGEMVIGRVGGWMDRWVIECMVNWMSVSLWRGLNSRKPGLFTWMNW